MQEANLVLPLSHSLESWGDAEPRRGVVSLVKPVLNPLHDTLSEGDILLRLMGRGSGEGSATGYREYLFDAWGKRYGKKGRDEFLKRGYVEESFPAKRVSLDGRKAASLLEGMKSSAGELGRPVLVLAPSLRTYDGRGPGPAPPSPIPPPPTPPPFSPRPSV